MIILGFCHFRTGQGDNFTCIEPAFIEQAADDSDILNVDHPYLFSFVDRIQVMNLNTYVASRMRTGKIIDIYML